MIDQIFADIMKEARERPGKDMIRNIATVSMDLNSRIIAAMEGIREDERREEYARQDRTDDS